MGRSDQILEKENGHPTHQTRVLEEQTRCRPQEKSVQSEAGQVLSVAAGGSGWPGLLTALIIAPTSKGGVNITLGLDMQ